jgi:hypothetical protein
MRLMNIHCPRSLPGWVGVEINRHVRSPCWDGADAATDCLLAINFYLTGMAGTHQTASGNGNASAGGDLE